MPLPSAQQLADRLQELHTRLSQLNPRTASQEIKEIAHQQRNTESLLSSIKQKDALQQQLRATEDLLQHEDTELATLAHEDLLQVTEQLAVVDQEIETLLLPRDMRDERDVILEIRAGAGGEEAALFAAELFRSYARYGELNGWKLHTLSTSLGDQGGFKEIVAEITGTNVFGTLKYERGVHRVQRVPATEKQGRIHTSTVTVAVLPHAEEVDMAIKPEDLRIDTYRSGGAGGQHVNKTSSAIRITHLPTNTVVAVQDERSQHKNKEKALSILRARLLEAQEAARHAEQASERKTQVGTGDRSEKIRTYNYPQDRVTDHRIKHSWGNIPSILNGEWEPIFKELQRAERELQLQQVQYDN